MADLRVLPDQGFDLLANPASTLFLPDLTPVRADLCVRRWLSSVGPG